MGGGDSPTAEAAWFQNIGIGMQFISVWASADSYRPSSTAICELESFSSAQ